MKKKKKSFLDGLIVGISGSMVVLLILLVATAGSVLWPSGAENSSSIGSSVTDSTDSDAQTSVLSSELLEKLSQCKELMDTYYLFDYDEETLESAILSAYMSAAGDPYTCYYTAEEMASMNESTEGTYYGVGISMLQNSDGTIEVVQVFHNGDAYAKGVQTGDLMYKVNDEEVSGTDLSVVVSKVRGEEGTTVSVEFYRPSTQEYYTVELERKEVQVDSITYHMLEDDIAYLRIYSFDSETLSAQMESALSELSEQGMKGLIIDLRDNPGGLVTSAVEALDLFLPANQEVVSMRDKNDGEQVYKTEDDAAIDVPMVVLMNGNSASASEIFAGAVKDLDLGTLVGTQSFGKGIVQYVIPLSDGSGVKITAAYYYTPSGVCVHGTGIAPDVEVELDTESDEDNQLHTAIDEVKKLIEE